MRRFHLLLDLLNWGYENQKSHERRRESEAKPYIHRTAVSRDSLSELVSLSREISTRTLSGREGVCRKKGRTNSKGKLATALAAAPFTCGFLNPSMMTVIFARSERSTSNLCRRSVVALESSDNRLETAVDSYEPRKMVRLYSDRMKIKHSLLNTDYRGR